MKSEKISFDVSAAAHAEFAKKFEKIVKDLGIFHYQDDGFTVALRDGPLSLRWAEVDRLVGYKRDDWTTDTICLDVEYGNACFTIDENTAGWFVFLDRTKAVFPGIPKHWEVDITIPAFATNLTVLYVRS